MRHTSLIALVALLSLSSRQVPAQDAETIADVRCVIVGAVLVQKADSTQSTAGSMLSMYFIGRLDGRVPLLDLEELIVKEISTMTDAGFAADAKRCGAALAARGGEITQIGKHLAERAKKTSGDQSHAK